MSLFVVNRYEGKDGEKADENASESHLSDLLKKIAERKKRKSTTELGKDENTEAVSLELPVRKKKRKQRKAASAEAPRTVDEPGTDVGNENQSVLPSTENDVLKEDAAEPTAAIDQSSAKNQDFVILGSDARKRKTVIRRVLPDWLANPEVISAEIQNGPSVSELESIVDVKLLDILRKNGMERLFPVQASTIPWLLNGEKERRSGMWPRDACISAPTGSGKTLAYVLPIVQLLRTRLVRKVRCLVVLPVQELAAQVYNVMKTYTAHTNLRAALLSGAASFQQEQHSLVKKTERGEYVSRVDIVVTTPGRLIDHIERTQGFSLSALRFLVIDEADRATDWLHHLPPPNNSPSSLNLSNIRCSSNRPAQKLLFSATLSQDPEKLSRLGLFQPKLFTSVLVQNNDNDVNLDKERGDFAGRYTSPNELTERVVKCEASYKPLALFQLLAETNESQRTLVFANSGETAHRLALLVQTLLKDRGLVVAEISARLAPKQREEVLGKFVKGEIQILVSSDALARGMDVPGVNLVVSYDLPKHIKGYIHRSGRTGRAGTPGTAVSILTPPQVGAFNKMLSHAHKTVPKLETIDALEELAASIDYQKHIATLKEILDKEQEEALVSTKAAKRKPRKPAKQE